jgi:hypothetical protein
LQINLKILQNKVGKYFQSNDIKEKFTQVLKQGLSPRKLAITFSLGFILSIFPMIGTTTALTLLCAYWFRLNYFVIQMINWLAAPLCLALMIPFTHLGQDIFGAEESSISIDELMRAFDNGLIQGFSQVLQYQLYAILGWVLIAMPGLFVLYIICFQLIKLYYSKLKKMNI